MNRQERIKQLVEKEVMYFSYLQEEKDKNLNLYYINIIKAFTKTKYYKLIISNHHKYNFNDNSSVEKLKRNIKENLRKFIKEKQQNRQKVDEQSIFILPLVLLSYMLFSTYILCEFQVFKNKDYWVGLFTAFPISSKILEEYDKKQSSKRSKLLNDLEIYLNDK